MSDQKQLPSCRDARHLVRFPLLLQPPVDRLDLGVLYRAAESVASYSRFRTLPVQGLLIRNLQCAEVPDLTAS